MSQPSNIPLHTSLLHHSNSVLLASPTATLTVTQSHRSLETQIAGNSCLLQIIANDALVRDVLQAESDARLHDCIPIVRLTCGRLDLRAGIITYRNGLIETLHVFNPRVSVIYDTKPHYPRIMPPSSGGCDHCRLVLLRRIFGLYQIPILQRFSSLSQVNHRFQLWIVIDYRRIDHEPAEYKEPWGRSHCSY